LFGSLAVNSKMLSRANHGADDANMPTTIIAHTPIAITRLSRVILMADPSCLAVLLQNIVYYPVTKVNHNQAFNSSIEYGHDDEVVARTQIDPGGRLCGHKDYADLLQERPVLQGF
jgi:hypothetical protein